MRRVAQHLRFPALPLTVVPLTLARSASEKLPSGLSKKSKPIFQKYLMEASALLQEKDQRLALEQRLIAEKDQRISEKEGIISDLNQRILSLNTKLDQRIALEQRLIAEKDQRISEKEGIISDLNRRISFFNNEREGIISDFNQRISSLKNEKEGIISDLNRQISTLNTKLGMYDLRELVFRVINELFELAINLLPDAFQSRTPPAKERKREEFIMHNAQKILDADTNSRFTVGQKRVLEAYVTYKRISVIERVNHLHHTLVPRSVEDIDWSIVANEARPILERIAECFFRQKNPPVFVAITLPDRTSVATDVAPTLNKEDLPRTVNGLKKAVLKECPHKDLVGKFIADLTVYPPGKAKGQTAMGDLDDVVATPKKDEPYHVEVA